MPDPIPPSNSAMAVAASALKAQQSRMRVIAENIANADSAPTEPGGTPYARKIAVTFAASVMWRQKATSSPAKPSGRKSAVMK